MKKTLFWGYLDDEGRITVKRYENDHVIRNYEMLPFVKGIFDPFLAIDMKEARAMILSRYRMEPGK